MSLQITQIRFDFLTQKTTASRAASHEKASLMNLTKYAFISIIPYKKTLAEKNKKNKLYIIKKTNFIYHTTYINMYGGLIDIFDSYKKHNCNIYIIK